MKYVKAQTIFPQPLLAEIQKYIQGEMVYMPKLPDNYAKWGANTDLKGAAVLRNNKIVAAFKTGTTIPELAKEFYFSEEQLKSSYTVRTLSTSAIPIFRYGWCAYKENHTYNARW